MFTCEHTECVDRVHERSKKTQHIYSTEYQAFCHCCFAILSLDPKNVLSSPGQCHFNEVDSVVMADTENHLATSYPSHKRGLLRPAVKYKQGISHLMCLTLCQLCPFFHHHFTSYFIITFQLKPHGYFINLMTK